MDEEDQLSLFETQGKRLDELPATFQIGEHLQIYIPENKGYD